MATWICKFEVVKTNPKTYCQAFNRDRETCKKCGALYVRPYRPDPGVALSPRVGLQAALEAYELAMGEAAEIFTRLNEISADLKAHGFDISILYHDFRGYGPTYAYETVLKEGNRAIWRRILAVLEVDRFASVARMTEIHRMIDRDQMPNPTFENATQFASGIVDGLSGMVAEKAQSVFRYLRPYSRRNLKTNDRFVIGKKAIVAHVFETNFTFGLHYTAAGHLDELESLLRTLDGKGHASKSALTAAIRASVKGDLCGETEYFAFKGFRNGNLHLTFLRMDLIEKINKLCTKNQLPE